MIKKPSVMVRDRGQLGCLRRNLSDSRRNVPFFFFQKIDVDLNCHNRGNAKKEKENTAFISDQFPHESSRGGNYLRGKVIGNEIRKSNERKENESRITRERESGTVRYERTQTGLRRWTEK
jgi:hypothetical protein